MRCLGGALLLCVLLLGGAGAAREGGERRQLRELETETEGEDGLRILEADVRRRGDEIAIERQIVRYRPVGLRVNTHYEVRVSFPSTNPVLVRLWVTTSRGAHMAAAADEAEANDAAAAVAAAAGGGGARRRRRLLDAEKVIFSTDNNGRVVYSGETYEDGIDVLFQAQRWTLHRDGADGAPSVLRYDIVLEENIWGVPVSAMPVVVTAVVITALVFVAVPFWARRGLPAVVGWLNSDGGGSGVKARRG